MTKRKTSLLIGMILLFVALIFLGIAISHPEFSFPWTLRITYMLYGLYVWLLFRFLLVIPVFQHMQGTSSGSIVRAIIYLLMAIVFFMIEITGDKVDIYTFLRGFVVTGSIDVCCENIYLLVKGKKE